MEGRKVIQITTLVIPGMDNYTSPRAEMLALCDDGTMWRGDGDGYWQQIQGPEHLRGLTNRYHTRQQLKDSLDAEAYEKVRGILSAGGVRL